MKTEVVIMELTARLVYGRPTFIIAPCLGTLIHYDARLESDHGRFTDATGSGQGSALFQRTRCGLPREAKPVPESVAELLPKEAR
jgi:hypothetical protein